MQTTANFYRLFRAAVPEVSEEMRGILQGAGLVT